MKQGRPDLAPGLLSCTGDFAWPKRWWIVGAEGKPAGESSRCERTRVASLAVQGDPPTHSHVGKRVTACLALADDPSGILA
ncbi:hypothetical protein ADL06_02140 [Streptomyces sp. NRRL F-6491]|nr:hypothetical protein ADL06_02140 [Streptomyces sp. NRRL F-6491]